MIATASKANRCREKGARSCVPYVVKASSRGWVSSETIARPTQSRSLPPFHFQSSQPTAGPTTGPNHSAWVGPRCHSHSAIGLTGFTTTSRSGAMPTSAPHTSASPAERPAEERLAERRPEQPLGERVHQAAPRAARHSRRKGRARRWKSPSATEAPVPM